MVDLQGQYKKIRSEVNREIKKVLKSATFINGPIVKEFELNLKDFSPKKCLDLQTRTGKRNGPAAIKTALDFMKKNKINHHVALSRISSNHINELLLPSINPIDEKQNNHLKVSHYLCSFWIIVV